MLRRLFYKNFCYTYALRSWFVRRFSAAGLLMLAGAGFSALVGLDTNQTLAFQLFSFLACLLMVSMLWSSFFSVRISVARIMPRYAACGSTCSYRLLVTNNTGHRQRGLYIREQAAAELPTLQEFSENHEPHEARRNPFDRFVGYYRWEWLFGVKQQLRLHDTPLPELLPGESREITAALTPLRRGTLELQGLEIVRLDPFGLCRSYVACPARHVLTVLPRLYTLPGILLSGRRTYQPGGVQLASSVGDAREFVSVREYRPGDPLRHIHWKSWAKTGMPIVKEYQDEYFVRSALVLDTFLDTVFSEQFEDAISVAASCLTGMQRRDALLDVLFVENSAHCFTTGRGTDQTHHLLSQLSAVAPCRNRSFRELSDAVLERAAQFSSCICVLTGWDTPRRELVQRLCGMGIGVLVLLVRESTESPTPDSFQGARICSLLTGHVQEGLNEL